MKIATYVDPDGIARERERAAYRVELIAERDRFLIAFLPVAEDRLTCLELVGVFSIALRPGVDRETAYALVALLREYGAGLDAVYGPDPDRPQPPTFPNVIPLRAAMSRFCAGGGEINNQPPRERRDRECRSNGQFGH